MSKGKSGKRGGLKSKFVDWFGGEIMLKMGFDRQVGFFLFIFALFCIIISWSLMVEERLVKVEKNQAIIEELEVSIHQRTVELVGLDQRTRIEKMLKACDSKLESPVAPAEMIVIE